MDEHSLAAVVFHPGAFLRILACPCRKLPSMLRAEVSGRTRRRTQTSQTSAKQVCTCFLKQPLTIPSITRMISTFNPCFDFEYKPLKELRPRPHLYSGHHPPSKILCELAHLFVHQNQWKIRLHCQHLNSCCLLQVVQIILGTLRAVNETGKPFSFRKTKPRKDRIDLNMAKTIINKSSPILKLNYDNFKRLVKNIPK